MPMLQAMTGLSSAMPHGAEGAPVGGEPVDYTASDDSTDPIASMTGQGGMSVGQDQTQGVAQQTTYDPKRKIMEGNYYSPDGV